VDHVHPHYRAIIERAPFAVLATIGPGGLDASPRGDPPRLVVVEDEKTLLMPDRRGNNRLDSLRNIVADPRVALLFMVPGIGETLRVNGRATLRTDPMLLARFAMDGKAPTCVLRIAVETVFFQCARAIKRARLWDAAAQLARDALPSTGTMLADLSAHEVDGRAYDRDLAARQAATLY
jgi:PPOX class probable FMN-dependent enzyme